MNPSPAFVVPEPVGAVLSRLPAYPGSLLLVTALNTVLGSQLPDDVKQYLANKKLRIHVVDARLTFDFTCISGRFVACQPRWAPGVWVAVTVITAMACAKSGLAQGEVASSVWTASGS